MEELPVALRGEIVLALAEQSLQRSHIFSQLSHEVRVSSRPACCARCAFVIALLPAAS